MDEEDLDEEEEDVADTCTNCGRVWLVEDLDEKGECPHCQSYQYEEHDGWAHGD